MASEARTVRILISSPGDVEEEREKARAVLAELQRWYGEDRVQLTAVLWEDLPIQLDTPFQAGIEAVLSATQGVDVAVFILWSRLGTPPGPSLRRLEGGEYESGTTREIDLMLRAREASGGVRPALLAYVREDDAGFRERLVGRTPDEMQELITDLQRTRSFVATQFNDLHGSSLRAYHVYQHPAAFAPRLRIHLRTLVNELLADEVPGKAHWVEAPYRGLEVFGIDEAPIFFGREREACEIEELLVKREQEEACAFLCVVGASGSGKSSLVRAGVAANLLRNTAGTDSWRAVFLSPRQARGNLVDALARAIWDVLPELAGGMLSAVVFCSEFDRQVETTLRLALIPALAKVGAKLLVVLDQLEELFTGHFADGAREHLWSVLDVLCRSGRFTVVTTLRSDFYAAAQRDAGFLKLKGKDGHFDLVAPSADSLAEIVQQPALLAGLRFERVGGRSLEARILSDALTHPAALPLLEYLLKELWQQRSGGLLTLAAYEELGGVAGAIGRRAEAAFIQLNSEAQAALPRLLRRLATVHGDGPITSRPTALGDLTGPAAVLAEALLAQRLLLADGDTARAHVRITHEALLREWPRARLLIEVDRERIVALARLEDSFQRWIASKHVSDLLLPSGLPLAEAEALVTVWADELSRELTAFVAASRRRGRRRRLIVGTIVLLTVVTLSALTVGALRNAKAASKSRAEAEFRAADAARKLRDAQIARSRLLSEFADRERNARVRVMLALESLPIRDERPLVSEALSLLGQLERDVPMATLEHPADVNSARFSSNGARVLTTSDGLAAIWDAHDGRNLHRVAIAAKLTDGKFSSNGELALVIAGTIATLVDAVHGRIVGQLDHGLAISDAGFLEPGREVVTVGDNLAVVWSVDSKTAIRRLEHIGQQHYSVVADTRLVSVNRAGSNISVWDLQAGRRLVTVHPDAPELVALSDDGRRALSATKSNLVVYNLDDGTSVRRASPSKDGLQDAGFSPDHQSMVIVGQGSEWVCRSDLRRLPTFDGCQMLDHSDVSGSAFSTDGKSILDYKPELGVYETATLTKLYAFKADNVLSLTSFPPGEVTPPASWRSGRALSHGRAISISASENVVKLWKVDPGTPARSIRLEEPILGLEASSDGAVVALTARRAAHWDARTGALHLSPTMQVPPTEQGALAAGHTTAVMNGGDVISIVDTRSGVVIRRIHPGFLVRNVAIDVDGSRVVGMPYSQKDTLDAVVFSVTTGEELYHLKTEDDVFQSASFSPDGRHLATRLYDGTVVIWDARTGTRLLTLDERADAEAFSNDGSQLVLSRGQTSILDTRTWNRRLLMRMGDASLIRFDREGKRLASRRDIGPAEVWDVETGQRLAVLPTGSDAKHIAWTLEGDVVVASEDQSLSFWKVPPALGARAFIDSVRARTRALGWCLSEAERAKAFLEPMPNEQRARDCRRSQGRY